MRLHNLWNDRHRVLTNSLGVMLAAITETSGIEPNAALDRADSAAGQLNDAGYPDEWEVARILARHTPEELAGLMRLRIDGIRAEKIRPDASGTVTLAALLTLGASVPPEHPLHTVFHGFVLREHYTASYRDATTD